MGNAEAGFRTGVGTTPDWEQKVQPAELPSSSLFGLELEDLALRGLWEAGAWAEVWHRGV